MNDCIWRCFQRNSINGAVTAIVIGAFLGFFAAAALCVALGGTVSVVATPVGGLIVTMSCGFVDAMVLAGALLALLSWLIFVLLSCKRSCETRTSDIGSTTFPGIIPSDDTHNLDKLDCTMAQKMLQEAMRSLAEAIRERDAQRGIVARLDARIRRARRAVEAAIAIVVATSFWNPIAMLTALAALALATAVLARASTVAIPAKARLSELEATVTRAQAIVATAQALVDELCKPADETPLGSTGDITVNWGTSTYITDRDNVAQEN